MSDTDVQNPYKVGDPVVDLAQGRPMVVLDAPAESVREWSDREDYDLTENYANAKLDAVDTEPVVECVYVSDIRSEPSKTYTFPASRVRLLDVHHADDGRRVWDRVAVEVLEQLFDAAIRYESETDAAINMMGILARVALGNEITTEARELADVAHTVGQEDGHE